jgi:predicted ATPase
MTTRRIPASRTPFVGRSAEVVEVSSLLEGSRVVTVTGAGGIGKTRVAYELARRSNASWVVAVELAGLRHDDQVVAEVASVLGSRRLDGIADVVGACDLSSPP